MIIDIIYQVGAGGSSLIVVCKKLYKLSKEDANDNKFREYELLEPLLKLSDYRLDSSSAFEIMLYSVGSLKNISHNEANLQELSKLGAVQVMCSWLGMEKIEKLKAALCRNLVNNVDASVAKR